MAVSSAQSPLVLAVGILGSIVSVVVYLAPLPTFYSIYKKKSSEGFQSLPYVVALLSAMLWIYYNFEKGSQTLLITTNAVGCVAETIYIALYIAFAPRQAKIFTLRLVIMLNFVGFGLVLLLSRFLASEGKERVQILGCICVVFSLIVFIAPLSIIGVVIRTKSVEFMPFSLSFFLTVAAILWLCYGVLLKDIYITLPNLLGLFFGVLQMGLYVFYKNRKGRPMEGKLPEHKGDLKELGTVSKAWETETETETQKVKLESKGSEGVDEAGKIANNGADQTNTCNDGQQDSCQSLKEFVQSASTLV